MTVAVSNLPSRIAVADLDFEVHVSGKRRSIGITVDRDGVLIVSAPPECDIAQLEAFAEGKRMWIYKKLAKRDLLLSERPKKEFVSGEGFVYLGRSYRLLLAEDEQKTVKLEHGRLTMPRRAALRGSGSKLIIEWYRGRAVDWIARRMRPWVDRMGVEPTGLGVRDLGYRWGSLGGNSKVHFHWATIQLTPTLIDYVIVHELAHLMEPSHSADFWLRVERALPNYMSTKAELARVGGRLWLGDTVRGSVKRSEETVSE
jgi:hypothetical protein